MYDLACRKHILLATKIRFKSIIVNEKYDTSIFLVTKQGEKQFFLRKAVDKVVSLTNLWQDVCFYKRKILFESIVSAVSLYILLLVPLNLHNLQFSFLTIAMTKCRSGKFLISKRISQLLENFIKIYLRKNFVVNFSKNISLFKSNFQLLLKIC